MSEEQPDLFDQPDPPPSLDPGTKAVLGGEQRARARDQRRKQKRLGPPNTKPTIQERFDEFHRNNPHVFDKLVEIALDAKRSGAYEA